MRHISKLFVVVASFCFIGCIPNSHVRPDIVREAALEQLHCPASEEITTGRLTTLGAPDHGVMHVHVRCSVASRDHSFNCVWTSGGWSCHLTD